VLPASDASKPPFSVSSTGALLLELLELLEDSEELDTEEEEEDELDTDELDEDFFEPEPPPQAASISIRASTKKRFKFNILRLL
jgi:hypothetical protein